MFDKYLPKKGMEIYQIKLKSKIRWTTFNLMHKIYEKNELQTYQSKEKMEEKMPNALVRHRPKEIRK